MVYRDLAHDATSEEVQKAFEALSSEDQAEVNLLMEKLLQEYTKDDSEVSEPMRTTLFSMAIEVITTQYDPVFIEELERWRKTG
jgi:hypothetical protein